MTSGTTTIIITTRNLFDQCVYQLFICDGLDSLRGTSEGCTADKLVYFADAIIAHDLNVLAVTE